MSLKRKYNSWLFLGVLFFCFAVSSGIRYEQFETWEKTPSTFFVGERPLMTTLDAPYWLRWAREYNEGTYKKYSLRDYPEGTEAYQKMIDKEVSLPLEYIDPTPSSNSLSSSEATNISYLEIPLLSFLIAHLSQFYNYNYYLTGTMLIPMLASLFILPLGIYFFRLGLPVSGLLGGLIGSFASGYYMRSSIGRIDTDMLNLFFPVLAALLILMGSQAKTERSVMLYSAGAGFSLFLFQWWYSRAGFTLVFFTVLVFSLFVHQIRFRTILLSALLFVLCGLPNTFMAGTVAIKMFLKNYFTIEEMQEVLIVDEIIPASFPNTLTTISEVDFVQMEEVLRRILSNTALDWLGLIALFGMAVFRWRVLLPLVPMLALGLLSFKSSNRFIMYLGPFVGIGLGWLLSLLIEGAFIFWLRKHVDGTKKSEEKRKGKSGKGKGSFWHLFYSLVAGINLDSTTKDIDNKGKDSLWEGREIDWFGWPRQLVLYLGMGLFFWGISVQTAISYVPWPSIHSRLYTTFMEVKNRITKDSVLVTWWDYGYAITDVTGLAVFHDGGSQTSPKTYFIARGLISTEQDELYDITQYLATEGKRGIAKNNTSPEALLEAVRNPLTKPWNPIYLFFTADMTGKYGAISKLGSWDLVNGGSKTRGYQNLACNKITNEEMNCQGAKIDLKTGMINNQVPLRRMVFIRDGQVLREQEFGHTQGYTLQLLVSGQRIVEVQLIDEMVFQSNYNQMFLLGRYREDLFEETYNAFPFSRLFRVKF